MERNNARLESASPITNKIERRELLLAAAGAISIAALPRLAIADEGDIAAIGSELKALQGSRPDKAPEIPANDYSDVLQRLQNFADELEGDMAAGDGSAAEALNKTYGLMAQLNAEIHVPPESYWENAPAEAAPIYDSVAGQYVDLFNSCQVRPDRLQLVRWYTQRISSGKSQALYRKVEAMVGVPWYFVGIVHTMEASLNFGGHLHNGDPLKARTVQVPKNMPKLWLPPSDWVSSAVDALTLERLAHAKDWRLPRMLYRLEAYNGWGYRPKHINSPYLWSFSKHYTQGKYVADGKWSAAAVSKQVGASVLLKQMVNDQLVELPS
jgi:lysozyme family protein